MRMVKWIGCTALAVATAACAVGPEEPAAEQKAPAGATTKPATVVSLTSETTVRITGDMPYDDPTAQAVPTKPGSLRFDLMRGGETVTLAMRAGDGANPRVSVFGVKKKALAGVAIASVGADEEPDSTFPLDDLQNAQLPDGATPNQKQAFDDLKDTLGGDKTCNADGGEEGGGAKFRVRGLRQTVMCVVSVLGASCSLTTAMIWCGTCIAGIVGGGPTAGVSLIPGIPSCVGCMLTLGASPAAVLNAVRQCE